MARSMLHTAVAAVFASGLSAPAACATEPGGFVVHEWGTFSTLSGSDGKPLKFTPNDSDLPAFVHSRRHLVKGGPADSFVSLETPVLYFYTDRDRTVAVRVDFPKGIMTDWFPEASRPPTTQLRWDNIRVLAKDRPRLTAADGRGRYFAARETDAATIVIATPEGRKETEGFLFYRGVGDFPMPFEVRVAGGGTFAVKNTGAHPVLGHVLVHVRDGVVSFASGGRLEAGAERQARLPAGPSTADKLGDTLAVMLVEQGLYEKEARAMVTTWRAAWFGENGTRVLYLVAGPVVDDLLPLAVDPKPDRTVRVLVGRHDVLTPERESEVDALVRRLHGDSNPDAKAADAALDALGRYRSAAQKAAEGRLSRR